MFEGLGAIPLGERDQRCDIREGVEQAAVGVFRETPLTRCVLYGFPQFLEYATMWNELPRGPNFWSFLLSIDEDLPKPPAGRPAPCGGRLHCANYPRRPRGCPDRLPDNTATGLVSAAIATVAERG